MEFNTEHSGSHCLVKLNLTWSKRNWQLIEKDQNTTEEIDESFNLWHQEIKTHLHGEDFVIKDLKTLKAAINR